MGLACAGAGRLLRGRVPRALVVGEVPLVCRG